MQKPTALAGLAGTQVVRVRNVLGGRTIGDRGALLHVKGTSMSGMVTKIGGADILHVRSAGLGEMGTIYGRADTCGLIGGARGLCCQGYQWLH